MKKKMFLAFTLFAAVCFAVIVIAGCTGAPKTPNQHEIKREQNAANVDTKGYASTVVDWSNRNLGEESVPSWLKPLVKGNTQFVKQEFSINPSARVKYSIAQRANREEARVSAGLVFAAQIANELKQYVVTSAAQTLNQGQMEIVEEITTATKINITGNQRVADFWQLVETTEPSGVKRREYIYYVIWSMDEGIWTQLVRKYVNDVIGKIPDTQAQRNIANAYAEIDAVSKREREMSDTEFKQVIDLRYQAASNAHEREMAKINVTTAQVQAESKARHEAYKSGSPAAAAVASTSSGDFDWINALSTAAKIIF